MRRCLSSDQDHRIDQCRVVTLELLKRTDRNTPSVSAQTDPAEPRVFTANSLREKLTAVSLSERVWCLSVSGV